MLASPRHGVAESDLDLRAVALATDRLATESLELMLERERRLIVVATRVRQASAELCQGEHAPVLGVQVMAAADLPWAHLAPAVRLFGVDDRLRVVWVLPEGPVARAGVRTGDAILAVDGRPVAVESELLETRALPGASALEFGLLRDGRELPVRIDYVPGCYFQPRLALGDVENASADRFEREIRVYSGLLRVVDSDDELAFVVAHEIGHAVLGHIGGSAPKKEADADYFATYLVARAGYDPEGGSRFFRRVASKPGTLVRTTHPSFPERRLAVEQAVREIAARRSASQDLVPAGLLP